MSVLNQFDLDEIEIGISSFSRQKQIETLECDFEVDLIF